MPPETERKQKSGLSQDRKGAGEAKKKLWALAARIGLRSLDQAGVKELADGAPPQKPVSRV